MLSFFLTIPDVFLLLALCVFAVILSIVGIHLVKRFIPAKLRNDNNPVIGNISALISLLYGVLAGLTALYLINNLGYTVDAVQREANAVANLYRDSTLLPVNVSTFIKKQLKDYLIQDIKIEWPQMKKGEELSITGDTIINNITKTIFSSISSLNDVVARDMVQEVKELYNARHQRISKSLSVLNVDMWLVIILGTILTIAINFLFGMHFRLQLLTVSAAAIMTCSLLFLLITLDLPFQGTFVVGPDALQSVLDNIHKTDS